MKSKERQKIRADIRKFDKKYRKALNIAVKLGIKVSLTNYIGNTDCKGLVRDYEVAGRWKYGKNIEINVYTANNYTILHEIGHVLNGYMCCNEHCEYTAHGSAIALARVFGIRLHPGAKRGIDVYAGRSARAACGAIEERKKVRNDEKTKRRK